MNRTLIVTFAAIATLCSVSAEDLRRDWTNDAGRTISASLIELKDGTATLKMRDGNTYDVELSTLSEADRDYAVSWQAEQEAEARRESLGLKLGVPTEVIVETAFDQDTPPTRKGEVAGWTAGIGEWRIEDGVLIGDEVPEDNHASSLTQRFEVENLILTAQVQLGSAEQIAFAFRDTVPPNLHLARLYITQDQLWIQKMSGIAKTTTAEKLVTVDVDLDPEAWYDVTIEIIGDQYRATVGEAEIEATHPRFADAKGILALVNRGQGAKYRNVSLWQADKESPLLE